MVGVGMGYGALEITFSCSRFKNRHLLNPLLSGACKNSSDDADLKRKEKYLPGAKLYMAILRTGWTFYHW